MRALVSLAMMLALLPVSFACAQSAQGTIYAVDYDRLYSVNPTTFEANLLGKAGNNGPQAIGDLSGLTTAPGGTLYAASDTLKALVRIDPSNGHATVVGDFGITTAQTGLALNEPLDFGMTYGCNGKLWLSSATAGKLWQVNPSNGASTLVGTFGPTISGLTMRGGKLLGAGARGDEGLYAIDTSSGEASAIGGYGAAIDYAASVSPGIDAHGDLLAAINYVPPPAGVNVRDWSDMAAINPDTGVATILGTITSPDDLRQIGIRGLTFGPPDCDPRSTNGKPPPVGPPLSNPHAVPSSGLLAALLQWLALAAAAGLALRRRFARL
ncbi:MAG: hypothetical protein L0H70_05185 [Xanthomonadales bacterium]|nr:hypothetical protein [Xanthomonadales bacterium]